MLIQLALSQDICVWWNMVDNLWWDFYCTNDGRGGFAQDQHHTHTHTLGDYFKLPEPPGSANPAWMMSWLSMEVDRGTSRVVTVCWLKKLPRHWWQSDITQGCCFYFRTVCVSSPRGLRLMDALLSYSFSSFLQSADAVHHQPVPGHPRMKMKMKLEPLVFSFYWRKQSDWFSDSHLSLLDIPISLFVLEMLRYEHFKSWLLWPKCQD